MLAGCALALVAPAGLAATYLLAASLGGGRVVLWFGAVPVGLAIFAGGLRQLQQAKIAKAEAEAK